MHPYAPLDRGSVRVRRAVTTFSTLIVVNFTLLGAVAVPMLQPKPQLSVEAARSPRGARLTFKGKGWASSARIKITGTRAPGASGVQDFGMFSADSSGGFLANKDAPCSTNSAEDGSAETVTITAADSASGAKASAKVQGGAWVCQ